MAEANAALLSPCSWQIDEPPACALVETRHTCCVVPFFGKQRWKSRNINTQLEHGMPTHTEHQIVEDGVSKERSL